MTDCCRNRVIQLLMLLGLSMLSAEDWPAWRGIHANGISGETAWNAKAIGMDRTERFRVDLGKGWSAVSVRGDRLYTMGNVGNQDIVYCLDAGTGREIWRYSYVCDAGNYPGPRSTPVLDENRLFVISREGHFICLDAGSGQVIWQTHLVTDHHAGVPTWGFAGSAVIEKNTVLVNAGVSGMAFDKTNGRKIWGQGGIGGYAAPVLFTFQGKRLAALFGEVKLIVVDASMGKVQWSHDWETSYHINAADPVIIGDRIFISSGYRRGCAMLQMTGNGAGVIWENGQMSNQFSSSVCLDGYIYGIDGNVGSGTLKCIDAGDGSVQWEKSTGFGSLMAAAGQLIVLNEKGDLSVVKAEPGGFQLIASASGLLKPQCWTAPVLSNATLYLRNNRGELLALDLKK